MIIQKDVTNSKKPLINKDLACDDDVKNVNNVTKMSQIDMFLSQFCHRFCQKCHDFVADLKLIFAGLIYTDKHD